MGTQARRRATLHVWGSRQGLKRTAGCPGGRGFLLRGTRMVTNPCDLTSGASRGGASQERAALPYLCPAPALLLPGGLLSLRRL